MRRWWPVAAAVAAAAAVALVVGTALGWFSGTPSGARSAPPLSVTASLAPAHAFFGDRVVAQVAVTGSPGAVAAARVEPSFAPFAAVGAPAVDRQRVGRLERRRYRWTLECLSDSCLPGAQPRTVQLRPLRVGSASVVWPPQLIASRLQASDTAKGKPPFRAGTQLPPPAYRVDPGALATWLAVAAGLLAAAGAAVLALELRRLAAARRRRALLGPLEAALLYAREAAGRPDDADRRKALGLLAEILRERDGELAETAEQLAWGEQPPSPARTLALAEQVESR